eukprot:g247.t1
MSVVVVWRANDPAEELRERRRILTLLGAVEEEPWHVVVSDRERRPHGLGTQSVAGQERLVVVSASTAPGEVVLLISNETGKWNVVQADVALDNMLDRFHLFVPKRDRRIEGTRFRVSDFSVGLGGLRTRAGTRHIVMQVDYLPCADIEQTKLLLQDFLEAIDAPTTALLDKIPEQFDLPIVEKDKGGGRHVHAVAQIVASLQSLGV